MGNELVGAIEAGGTKIVLAVARSWRDACEGDRMVVATRSPTETLDEIGQWFEQRHAREPLVAVGVASFGPLDFANLAISRSTPKEEWRGISWADTLRHHLGDLPIALDTDTNAAALAEYRWGAAQGRDVVAYLTVGTGIGGGLVVNGRVVHGLLHPEFGHMVISRRVSDDFVGACPAHRDCLEGMASGVAVRERWRLSPGEQLPPDHPAWVLESEYLADAVINTVAITSAEIVILGGGIMNVDGLLERVQRRVRERMNGYLAVPELTTEVAKYVVAPGLGANSGIVGAFELAHATLA